MIKLIRATLWGGLVAVFLAAISFTAISCHSGSSKNEKDTIAVKADTVKPVTGIVPMKEDSSKQYIFLTFDDGPQPPGTKNVYELCKQLGVKASFFMVSDNEMSNLRTRTVSQERAALVDGIRNSYPQLLLCNHSTSHAFGDKYNFFYAHPDSALQDFLKAQQFLNVRYKIIRLPGNSVWVRQGEVYSNNQCRAVSKLLDSCGYNVIGWDLEWDYSKGKTQHPVQSADKILGMIKYQLGRYTHTKNNLVLLSHDRMFAEPSSRDTLAKVITALKNDPHYVLETIDKYPGLKTTN